MNAAARAEHEIDDYLKRLRPALSALPAAQADDIIKELRSHLIDTAVVDNQLDTQRVADAIARLGDPATLASAYLMDNLALRAQTTRSPLLLLRLVALWAARYSSPSLPIASGSGSGKWPRMTSLTRSDAFRHRQLTHASCSVGTSFRLAWLSVRSHSSRQLDIFWEKSRKYRRIRDRDTAWTTPGDRA